MTKFFKRYGGIIIVNMVIWAILGYIIYRTITELTVMNVIFIVVTGYFSLMSFKAIFLLRRQYKEKDKEGFDYETD